MSAPSVGENGFLMKDDDCHWYFIKSGEVDAFRAWVAAEGASSPDFNDRRINNPESYLVTWTGMWRQ